MLNFSSESYESLYVEHEPSARRLALSMVPADVADDIVAEAFARVLAALRAGGGPDHAFRAYLLTAVRHLAYDWQQARRRLTVVADMDVQAEGDAAGPDPVSPQIACAAEVQAEARDEARLVTRAFGRLPARWRAVLWQLEVEGKTPAAVAPIFGLSANGVSALAMRAREGLRQAYLEEHVGTNIPAECRSYAAEFGAGARGRLGQRRRAAMQEHLGHCPSCQYLFTELTELNSRLGAILTPAALAAASSALGSAKRTVHLRTALTSHWRTWRWHPVTTVSGAAAGIAVAGGMLLAVNITPLTSTPAPAPVAPASGSPVSTRNPGGDAAAGSAARTSAHAALLSSVGTGSLVGAGSPASTIAPSETSPSASITPARSGGPAPAGSGLVTVTNTPPSPGQPITDTTTSAVTSLTDTATYAVTGLTDTATNAVTGLAKTAGVVVTGLANTAGATVTVVTDTASGLASAATSTVNGATSTAIGAVTGITSNAGTTLATAGKTVSNVARTATNAATTVVGTATSTATSVAAPAATTVTSAAAAVPSLASTAAAATASTVGTASTAVTAVASTASTATTATATTVSTAVAATTTAVARTTTSTAGSVAEPVASTAVTATAGSNSTNIATVATNTVSSAVGSL